LTAVAPEFYNSLVVHGSYIRIIWEFITDPKFTLESRVIHPSYVKVASNTVVSPRPSGVESEPSDLAEE
jgi:hypothetical protein